MKLLRIYSTDPQVFVPVEFNPGVSAVLAEIRVPKERGVDSHNLGKSTFGTVIDYCLLRGKDKKDFLYKHFDRFKQFTFYLELQLDDTSFLTIGRPVDPGTRVRFKRSLTAGHDMSLAVDDDWDHLDVPFDKAKDLLDGWLSLDVLRPWRFRKLAGYLLRGQRDYDDVFQLGKFSGKHQDWKPFVGHLLGLEPAPIEALYSKHQELADSRSQLGGILREWGDAEVDPVAIGGVIAAKRREIERRQRSLDAFRLGPEEVRTVTETVESVDRGIARLNEESYYLAQLRSKITDSLKADRIDFEPDAVEELFHDAGLVFGEQLKKDYQQLIAFNRAITRERSAALRKQLKDAEARAADIRQELEVLDAQRARSLAFLRSGDTLAKFKDLTGQLAASESELVVLEARREAAAQLLELRRQQRALTEEINRLQTQVEDEIQRLTDDPTSRFALIQRYFDEILVEVLGHSAILTMTLNAKGLLDLNAEFVDEAGAATGSGKGTTYRKLLCIAFDLAVLRAYIGDRFPRFVYHDGAFEGLDPRKRQNLMEVLRAYAAFGLQPIVSLLASDRPAGGSDGTDGMTTDEVVLRLHDQGQDGLLFRMPPW